MYWVGQVHLGLTEKLKHVGQSNRMTEISTTNRTTSGNGWTWLTSERDREIKDTEGWKMIASLWKLSWAILFSPNACMTVRVNRLCLQEAETSQAGEDSGEQTLDIWVWDKGRLAFMLTSHHICGRDGWLPVKKQHQKQLPEAIGNCRVARPGSLHLFHPLCPKINEGFTILHSNQTNKTAETFYPLYCIWLLSQGLPSLSCPPSMAMWLVLTNEITACPALKPKLVSFIFNQREAEDPETLGHGRAARSWKGAWTPESPPGGQPPAKYGTHIGWDQEQILKCVKPLLGFYY